MFPRRNLINETIVPQDEVNEAAELQPANEPALEAVNEPAHEAALEAAHDAALEAAHEAANEPALEAALLIIEEVQAVANNNGLVEGGDIDVIEEQPGMLAEDNDSVSSDSSLQSEEDMDNLSIGDENDVGPARAGIIAHESPLIQVGSHKQGYKFDP